MQPATAAAILGLAAISATPAVAADGKAAFPGIADVYAEARYRYEFVDQDGLPNNANASTLRVRVGAVTETFKGFSLRAEGEAIVNIGDERFNDTINGKTGFPVVADPEDFLLNQLVLNWKPDAAIEASVGRQAVNYDNQRWVGSVGWRQNDQTLDAATAAVKPLPGLALSYAYAWRVNRVFGPDSPQGIWRDNDIHLLRAAYQVKGVGTLSSYGYWLDLPNAPTQSSRTFGVRFAGDHAAGKAKLLYAAEFATQSDHGGNPATFSHEYLLVEPGVGFGPVTVKVGIERLSGNGVTALQTPLATLHAFNGWADKFLLTPARGLRDLYGDIAIKVAGKSWLAGTQLRAVYHEFDPTVGGGDYGSEIDLLASRGIGKHFTLTAKYADYDSNGFAADTRKFWLQAEAKF